MKTKETIRTETKNYTPCCENKLCPRCQGTGQAILSIIITETVKEWTENQQCEVIDVEEEQPRIESKASESKTSER